MFPKVKQYSSNICECGLDFVVGKSEPEFIIFEGFRNVVCRVILDLFTD